MINLIELDLDDNPISEDKGGYYQTILGLCNSLEILDSVEIEKIKEDYSQIQIPSIKMDKDQKLITKFPENNEDDFQEEHDYTTDLTESRNKLNVDKEQDFEPTKNFSKSQSQFRRKGAEEATKSKSHGKSVPKYKSASPHKKNETQSLTETKHKVQGQNSGNTKNALLGNQTKDFKENEVSNLEPEKVIQIIQEQFFEEIARVEVVFLSLFFN